jgi:hypothetical protein
MSTIVVTSIYNEFWGTRQFHASCKNFGLPYHNAFRGTSFKGNGDVLNMLSRAYVDLSREYHYAIYADGADSFFQKEPPAIPDYILWSTEKQVWPVLPQLKQAYDEFYKNDMNFKYSPWMFLNGGGVCGPTKLLSEFYIRYGLHEYAGKNINGQKELSEAFLKAKKEGFPIKLDTQCEFFQTTAFEHPTDFSLAPDGKGIVNNFTGTYPVLLHGNGRTDMTPIYKRFNLVK